MKERIQTLNAVIMKIICALLLLNKDLLVVET
jgi:hypothetical protein